MRTALLAFIVRAFSPSDFISELRNLSNGTDAVDFTLLLSKRNSIFLLKKVEQQMNNGKQHDHMEAKDRAYLQMVKAFF